MAREITTDEFEQLYRATSAELFGYVRRRSSVDPEDLVAEVYAVAWRRRAALPAPLLRRAWLFGTARRLLLAEARTRGRQELIPPSIAEPAEPAGPADLALEHVVARALARLRPDEREVVQLVEWERLTPAEVAVVLGIRPGAARVRLHRARQALAADSELRALVPAG